MSELSSQFITYQELRSGNYHVGNDKFGIASYMTQIRKDALLSCPNNIDDSKTAMLLLKDEDVVVGRTMLFGTKVKMDDKIFYAQSGSALEVEKQYRSQGAGAELILYSLRNKEYDFKVSAGFTSMVLPLYRKIKYEIFELPQYIKVSKSRCVVNSYTKKPIIGKFVSFIGDFIIRILDIRNRLCLHKLNKNYSVKKIAVIPEWVQDIVLNDGHKYQELHDVDWFQWNLDHHFNDNPHNVQNFYAVYDKDNEPQGFFMTKERFVKDAGRYSNLVRGTVVEWGIKNGCPLKEKDLYLLSLPTFSSDVDIIVVATDDKNTANKIWKAGFLRHGSFQIIFKDKKKQYPESNNQLFWRLRCGYCDSIMS